MTLSELIQGLSVEWLGNGSIALFVVIWDLKTPERRADATRWFIGMLAFLRELMLPGLRNPWTWPLFLAIPVGIGMEFTRWAGMVELAGGALASVYVCAGAYRIVRGGVDRINQRLR